MGGSIATVYRSPAGVVTSWVRWTNTLPQIFLDVRLGSDPDAVMGPRLAQLTDLPQKKGPNDIFDPVGYKLPRVMPEGYDIVVIDALPVASGGKVKITSCQGYCDPEDVTTSLLTKDNLREERSKGWAASLDALFAKFPPLVTGWVPERLAPAGARVFRRIPADPRDKNPRYRESLIRIDLTEDFGSPKTVAELAEINWWRAREEPAGLARYEGFDPRPLYVYVRDRDIEFRNVEEGDREEVARLLQADGFELDLNDWKNDEEED